MTKKNTLFSNTAIVIAVTIAVISAAFFVKTFPPQSSQVSQSTPTPSQLSEPFPSPLPTVIANTIPGDYQGWNFFTDEEYGFSLKYPNDGNWEVRLTHSIEDNSFNFTGYGFYTNNPRNPQSDKKVAECYIVIYENTDQRHNELYDFSSKQAYSERRDVPMNELIFEELAIAGHPVQKVTRNKRFTSSGNTSGEIFYKFVGDEYSYILGCDNFIITNPPEREVHLLFEKIVQTFTLLD